MSPLSTSQQDETPVQQILLPDRRPTSLREPNLVHRVAIGISARFSLGLRQPDLRIGKEVERIGADQLSGSECRRRNLISQEREGVGPSIGDRQIPEEHAGRLFDRPDRRSAPGAAANHRCKADREVADPRPDA